MQLLINILLVHVVLSYLGRVVTLYLPSFSENPVIEFLNMNQRKIVTSSVILLSTVWIGTNLKIKAL